MDHIVLPALDLLAHNLVALVLAFLALLLISQALVAASLRFTEVVLRSSVWRRSGRAASPSGGS
jgi:hypothetical protein